MSCVIFDLDGTLADCKHRKHYIHKPAFFDDADPPWESDWAAFFEACDRDRPIYPVISIYKQLDDHGVKLYIFSGRSDNVREKTRRWLRRFGIKYELLFMRPSGDVTPDEELKASWVEIIGGAKEISYVFDDRDKVVKMWRSLGITCFQVAEGDF